MIELTTKDPNETPYQIDEEDKELVQQYTWQSRDGYVISYDVWPPISMHRLIMGFPEGLVVDHLNRDRADNRRCNLKVCTIKVNNRNRESVDRQHSKYYGVCKRYGKWRSYLKVNGMSRHIGYYDEELTAARAHDAALRYYYPSDDRWLNFTDIDESMSIEELQELRGKKKVVEEKIEMQKFTGVSRDKNKWRSRVSVKGKDVSLGSYNDPVEAAWVRDCVIREHGFEGKLNFPYMSERINLASLRGKN